MTRYWLATGLLLFVFLGLFLLVEPLHISFLVDPAHMMNTRSLSAALAGVALLVADVILPVPSSLIMIANGALFGVGLGTFLSLIGNLGAAVTGFLLGRRSETLLARFVPHEERSRANRLLREWGLLAIIITRPIPLLAETTIVMAGASTMPWQPMLLASLAGSCPIALLYAFTGATAVNFESVVWAFGLALGVAGLFWSLRHRFKQEDLLPDGGGHAQRSDFLFRK
jgi:uncharacterized membrane protein YdjX (TVP38/TMEM64 family)